MLRLDPCGLAIQTPRWSPSEPLSNTAGPGAASVKGAANSATKSAANATAVKPPGLPRSNTQIGTLGVGGDGVLSLRIGGSGRLAFDWTLRGRQETAGALAFALNLPPSPSIQLQLQLPPGLIPAVEQGFVTKLPSTGAASSAATTPGPSKDADRQTMQTWQIDLGGQNQVVLHLSPRDLLGEHRPLTLVRQSLVYDVAPQGLQLSAELKLDVLGEPVRQLTLLVDRPLELVTARCGDAQIPWAEIDSLDPARAASWPEPAAPHQPTLQRQLPQRNRWQRRRRVVLDFPEPLVGRGRVIRLGAVAPLPKQGRIPTVRPASDGAFWREGTASLLVSRPLELNELRLARCPPDQGRAAGGPAGWRSHHGAVFSGPMPMCKWRSLLSPSSCNIAAARRSTCEAAR